MDKKNFTIGAVLLVAAFGVMILGPRSAPTTKPGNEQTAAVATPPAASTTATTSAPSAAAPGAGAATTAISAPAAAPAAPSTTFAAVHVSPPDARITVLANDYIEARFSEYGGALLEVALKHFPEVQGKPEPYVFNHRHEDPILALTDYPGLGRDTRYELVSSSPTEVVYRAILEGRLEVTRRYRLTKDGEPGADPYRVRHETTFRNLTSNMTPLGHAALGLGTARLMNAKDTGQFLTVASYDGDSSQYTDPGELAGGGLKAMVGGGEAKPALEKPGTVVWGAVKNQFFTSIYTADTPGTGIIVRRVELPAFTDSTRPNIAVSAAARFDLPALAANGTAKMSGTVYVGPLEYRRIKNFEHHEDRVFPYYRGFNRFFLSGTVSPFQNLLLNATHRWVGNWGIAIILMTLILKLVSLPFTLTASRSAKRMAKLQPAMQAVREKYKDNPQKQQQATMELFKEHKVNPLGGCIPVLITFPLFIGFFAMLQGTAELRFQPFLWAKDLAAPDTVGHLFGFPINIMPILMGVTMIFQMRLTPTPSVDNMQAKMMQFMPIIFIMFCYNFSCALSLYSTINGLFTIGQQLVINRTKDDPGPVGPGATAVAAAAAWQKKPVKNVTPKKK